MTARSKSTCSPWSCAQSLFCFCSYSCSFEEDPNNLRIDQSNHRRALPHRQCHQCMQMYRQHQVCLNTDALVLKATLHRVKTVGNNQTREVMKLQPMSRPSSASASRFNCLVRPSSSHVFDMSKVTAPSPPSPI